MNGSYVWGTFVVVGVLGFLMTTSVRQGVALGLGAAVCVGFSLAGVAAQWREALSRFTSARSPEEVAEDFQRQLAAQSH